VLAPRHENIWFLADGAYSMFADFAPFAELADCSTATSMPHHTPRPAGKSVRPRTGRRARMYERLVAASLNKSFAASGARCPRRRADEGARTSGGPMIFSGLIQPMLGAAIASADILSDGCRCAARDGSRLRHRRGALSLATRDAIDRRALGLCASSTSSRLLDDGFHHGASPCRWHAACAYDLTLHAAGVRMLVGALARHVLAARAPGRRAARLRAPRRRPAGCGWSIIGARRSA
jgi:hypothetical protein